MNGRLVPTITLLGLLFATSAACSKSPDSKSREVAAAPSASTGTSSIGAGTPATPPLRIVTIGSSTTEIVFALGAGESVVGVDTSSLYPAEATRLPKVGYQRALAAEGLLSLNPTLIVGGPESGPPAVLAQLRGAGPRLEIVDAPATVEGAIAKVRTIAALLHRDPSPLLAKMERDLAEARALVARAKGKPRVLALYARGAGTTQAFGVKTAADAMLVLAGGENALSFEGAKAVTAESVVAAKPDVVLLPTRGLESLGGKDAVFALPGLAATPAARTKNVVAVDDLLLLGFGPRVGEGVSELARALHPELGKTP